MANGVVAFSGCFRCRLKFKRTAYFYQIQFERKLIRNEQLNQEIRHDKQLRSEIVFFSYDAFVVRSSLALCSLMVKEF